MVILWWTLAFILPTRGMNARSHLQAAVPIRPSWLFENYRRVQSGLSLSGYK